MAWVSTAFLAGVIMTTIGLRISIGDPIAYFFSAQGHDEERGRCFPALFSLGSSVADTGTQAVAFPPQSTQNSPCGSTFFGKPVSRYSDGRLNIDFWASALKIPLLDPYLKSVGSNFRRGVNFAAAGATAQNASINSPFPLQTQFSQFLDFKSRVLALGNKGSSSWSRNKGENDKFPLAEYFGKALYIIAIGGNDIIKWAVIQDLPLEEVELLLPESSQEILRVVEGLYREGARHILVEDVFPQGCTPYFLTKFASMYPDELDAVGCVKPINRLVQLHNAMLKKGVHDLARRFPDASISYVDTYSRRYSILANHDHYGFTEPVRACCGAGGEYNFRSDCICGMSKMENGVLITGGICANLSAHAVWDSLHFTDAFNRLTMQGILSGKYFSPSFSLIRNGCSLEEKLI